MITEEIIKQAQQGDSAAFTQIYNDTIKTAYYVARRILIDETATEDVLQESYIAVYQHLGDYSTGNFQGWVDTIVANRAKDYLRKKNPVLFSQMETEDNPVVDFEEEKIEFRPEASVDYGETKRLVMEMIDGLSPEQRLATILFYFEQKSVKEIAQICDCTENTIKSRLNYARKKIKDDVLALEKKGTKLYCAPIIPFLYWMLRQEAVLTHVPVATQTAVAAVAQSAVQQTATGVANVAGAASTTAQATAQTVAQAATGVATKTGMALSTKIIIGVVAATLVVGGGAVAVPAIQNYLEESMEEEDVDRDEKDSAEETEDDGMITLYTTTDDYSDEELAMFEDAIAGGMTYVHYFRDGSVWSAEEVPDQLKIFAFYNMMERFENESYICGTIDSFVEAGLMEASEYDSYGRTHICARMSLEQYMSAQEYIWGYGISKEAAKQYLDDMASQGGYVFSDGSYGIYPTYEYSGCEVENIMVQEDSTGKVFFNADGFVYFDGEEIARYEIQFDLVKNEESPFAGLTITNIQYQLLGETDVEDEEEDEVVGSLFKTDFYSGNTASYALEEKEIGFGDECVNNYIQIARWSNTAKQDEWNDIFINNATLSTSSEDLGQEVFVVSYNDKYLGIVVKGSWMGGMHPYASYHMYNINMQTGEEIKFEDVVNIDVCATKIANGEYTCNAGEISLEDDILFYNYSGDSSLSIAEQFAAVLNEECQNGTLLWYVQDGKLTVGFYTYHALGDYVFLTIE